MALTRTFRQTVAERVAREPVFARALLDEAATLFLNGKLETARLILRDLIDATIGFEQLAALTGKPSKTLHRMLSPAGNPSVDTLVAIFHAIQECLNVSLEAHSGAAGTLARSLLTRSVVCVARLCKLASGAYLSLGRNAFVAASLRFRSRRRCPTLSSLSRTFRR